MCNLVGVLISIMLPTATMNAGTTSDVPATPVAVLSDFPGHLAYSPNGRYLCFSVHLTLHLVDFSTDQTREIDWGRGANEGFSSFAWVSDDVLALTAYEYASDDITNWWTTVVYDVQQSCVIERRPIPKTSSRYLTETVIGAAPDGSWIKLAYDEEECCTSLVLTAPEAAGSVRAIVFETTDPDERTSLGGLCSGAWGTRHNLASEQYGFRGPVDFIDTLSGRVVHVSDVPLHGRRMLITDDRRFVIASEFVTTIERQRPMVIDTSTGDRRYLDGQFWLPAALCEQRGVILVLVGARGSESGIVWSLAELPLDSVLPAS